MSTVLETLEAARNLISDPDKWTKGAYARDRHGARLHDACDASAVCWCMMGAIGRIQGRSFSDETAWALVKRAAGYPIDFNDTHTHSEVLAAFDAAIAKEKEAQHA